MIRIFSNVAMMAVLATMAAPLHSQDVVFKSSGAKATLIELYSSEGCSSCPPAEAWISNLKTAPGLWSDLFPVVFHVDYWDGLGWPDRFAKAAYTQRQRNYAAQLGQDSVYTPEFVANGREWRGWFDGGRHPAAIDTSGELSLQVKEGGKSATVFYVPGAHAGAQAYTVNVALLGINISSDVKGGENGGRHLRHDFVVLDFASMTMGIGKSVSSGPLDLKPSTGEPAGAIVAWISASDGSILQMTGGWLKPAISTAALNRPDATAQANLR